MKRHSLTQDKARSISEISSGKQLNNCYIVAKVIFSAVASDSFSCLHHRHLGSL